MIIDVNVNLSRWPFRRLPCDEVSALVERLDQWDVAKAWAGSFDGLFHRDVGGVNLRLADDCIEKGDGRLVPFGTVNPMLPDWQEDLRRCHEDYHMPGIRLHPNYHGYTLDDPVCRKLLAMADERGLIVQLAVRMDDDRVRHPLMQVADIDVKPLAGLAAARPNLRLVLLNALRTIRSDELKRLVSAGNVHFEISMLEGVGGVAKLLETIPLERVLFGSHLPLFNLESAILKMRESELPPEQSNALLRGNAKRLLAS